MLRPIVFACFALLLALSGSSFADVPRVLDEGTLPDDARLQPPKDLNGYFPFDPPESRAAWEPRSAELRQRVLVATGLWPLPEKTPLNAVVHGRVERDGFTVEKVYFESYPGHFVTGLLFRPSGRDGPFPGVLCPHGHGGRQQDLGEKGIRFAIVQGAERFEDSGRFPELARCAQLARMGCVAFIYDMLGYADSVQIPYELAHRFAEQRPEFDSPESWGLFSAQAELRLQSVMGIQTWNSVRALDFLAGLPDVDESRLGVTGGSGGGTQTILLGAIDPRPVVAFPQGMVSTSMQGGCTCENCSLLRIGTGNVELAGLFAPRPQAMTSANDWTKEMETKGFPELQQLYDVLGAKQNVMLKTLNHFPHNYNYVTRAIMYSWFNKHLGLGLEEPIVEEDYELLSPAEQSVWNDEHPAPAGGPDYERSLTQALDEMAQEQLAALTPRDEASLQNYRSVVGAAIDTLIGRGLPPADAIEREKIGKHDRGDYLEFTDLLRLPEHGEELPVVSLYPASRDWNGQVVIWIDGAGKSGLYRDGRPRPEILTLLGAGAAVLSADLLYQGEFLADGEPLTETPVVENPREFAGYTFGYNHTVFARRVHDILTLISFVRHDEHEPERVDLVGVGGAGPLVAAARAQAGDAVDRTAVDTGGFRFTSLSTYRDPNFLPGIVKYGDLPGLLSLAAPGELWLAGEDGAVPQIVAATYKAAGAGENVISWEGPADEAAAAAASWLLRGSD